MDQPARGYIALMAAILISAMLLGGAATLSDELFSNRFDTLSAEFKKISVGYAESCLQVALLHLAENPAYTVRTDPAYDAGQDGVPVAVRGGSGCLILGPTTTPPFIGHRRTFRVTARGTYTGAYTTLSETATVLDPGYAPDTSEPVITLSDFSETP